MQSALSPHRRLNNGLSLLGWTARDFSLRSVRVWMAAGELYCGKARDLLTPSAAIASEEIKGRRKGASQQQVG